LIVRPVGDEVVVYDPATHTAHCLNRTAAIVFGAADGRASLASLATRLTEETGLDSTEDVVWAALESLEQANLLEERLPSRPTSTSLSRRGAMRRVGLGVAALAPVIVSLVVPTPAEAANTCIPDDACTPSTFGQPCWVTDPSECSGTVKICNGGTGPSACQ
jgi:hypothetical protein